VAKRKFFSPFFVPPSSQSPSPGNRATDVQATLRRIEDQRRDPERAAKGEESGETLTADPPKNPANDWFQMEPAVGFEPTTDGLQIHIGILRDAARTRTKPASTAVINAVSATWF
jgi:hypothetical protein